jgi:UDP-3-O-acyl-N-acetylglucosamine deacetylase
MDYSAALRWNETSLCFIDFVSPFNSRSGIYFLRTSLKEDEKILWQSYNTIREIEYTNRVIKTDTDETSMAHLHLGLLAYQIANIVRFQFRKKDIIEKRE